MPAPSGFNWNDLRFFLACARSGSLTRASQTLSSSLSTVSRRIAALESELGSALFLRTPEGLLLTPAGQAILDTAERVERSAFALAERVGSVRAAPQGTVRVSLAGSDLLALVLLPRLGPLLARWPGLSVELESSSTLRDLVRREADIAIRGVRPTTGEELLSRQVRVEPFGVYASARYLERLASDAPLESLDWIGGESDSGDAAALRQLSGGSEPRIRVSDHAARRAAVQAGLGCSILSRTFAELTPGLLRLPGTPFPVYEVPLFLVCHQSQRHIPRVAVVWDWLVDEMANRDQQEIPLLRARLADLQAAPPTAAPPSAPTSAPTSSPTAGDEPAQR